MSTSIPEITTNAGIYLLEWGAEDVRVCIDRLADNHQSTSGEVTIRYRPSDSRDFQHLHQARLNLTSTPGRHQLAKHLSERVGEIDWGAILEQSCVKVLEKHREGEPLKKVGKNPIPSRADRYLLHPFLLANQPNLFYGTQGVAKSTLAAKCALETEGNTLWLDYEWSEGEVNTLVKRLKDGMGLDPDLELDYRFCAQPLADDIQAIQRMVLETNAQLVIIDSVGKALGGDPVEAAPVLRYFTALRSLKVTTLSIDHVAKEATGPFGSAYKLISARNAWEVIRGSSDTDHLAVGLHHRKINSGPLLKPLGFKFTYQADAITVQRADPRAIPEILATMPLVDQMEAALIREPMKPAELAEELGKKPSHISKELSLHKERFMAIGGGKWAVKAKDADL